MGRKEDSWCMRTQRRKASNCQVGLRDVEEGIGKRAKAALLGGGPPKGSDQKNRKKGLGLVKRTRDSFLPEGEPSPSERFWEK